jgi:6-phosphogluconate dehydrogenase
VAGKIAINGFGRTGRMLFRAALRDPDLELVAVSAALYERFGSRGEADFADQVMSALRYEFGADEEEAAAGKGGA